MLLLGRVIYQNCEVLCSSVTNYSNIPPSESDGMQSKECKVDVLQVLQKRDVPERQARQSYDQAGLIDDYVFILTIVMMKQRQFK